MKHLLVLLSLFITLTVSSQETTFFNSVLNQLNLNKSKIKSELVVSKEIPNNPNETILVIPEIVVEEEDYFELNSHILIIDSETGNIKYSYFESSKTNNWTSDAIQLVEISIDTAPYKISEQERSFGVKVRYLGSSRPNPYESETISLFMKAGTTLKKVLNNYEILYFGGEWDTNCAGEFMKEKKILIISKNKTNGYFNILVKNTITNSKAFLNEQNECDEKKTIVKENTVLKYNDDQYQ